MDQTGAVVRGGVVGEVDRTQPVVARVHMRKRVAELEPAELLAAHRGHHRAFEAVALQAILDACCGQQQQASIGIDQRVIERRVQVERLVGRNRPGGGRPDDRKRVLRQRAQAEGGGKPGGISAGEGDIERVRGLVGVLDLELRQRRAAVEAPVHRLQSTVDVAAFHHALEHADLAGLVAEIHRAVRMPPVAQHAEALEVGHLQRDLLGRIGAALGLDFGAGQVAAEGLLDLVLDRQTVAIPAGNVGRVEAFELPRLDDHVLQDLVDGVADVQLSVGVGRAVVQDELRRTATGVAQPLVQALVVPRLDPCRLALGQVATHRERGVGQVQRGTQVGSCVGAGGRSVVGHGGL